MRCQLLFEWCGHASLSSRRVVRLRCLRLIFCPSSAQPPSPFFFFNDTATTEIYTLSLHDALPIFTGTDNVGNATTLTTTVKVDTTAPSAPSAAGFRFASLSNAYFPGSGSIVKRSRSLRSEEHTSQLQSHSDLVCRLLLEKKKSISR